MPPEFQPGGASDDRKWTVMVFMGADTIAGNAPLIDSAEADLAEMRSVGSGSKLNIFVQVHRGQNTVPRRGQITSGMLPGIEALEPVSPDEADPARGRALESFILDALTKADYRAGAQNHHVMLVLWGHAYDFAIGREHTRGGTIDALDFAELSGVLENLQRRFGATGAKLDILGFDACDLATVEMAYQLQPFAKYLLGSQIGIPLPVISSAVVILVEFLGGIALILGLATRWAALLLAIDMAGAIFFVHFKGGFYVNHGGYEYALSLLAACLALTFSGAGALAIDSLI